MEKTTLIEEINKEAFELVKLISVKKKVEQEREPKRVLKGTIVERDRVQLSDIDGTGIAQGLNQSEKTSDIALHTTEESYGLHEQYFARYQAFVKKILTVEQFKDVVSEDFITNRAFQWIMDVYSNKKAEAFLSEYLSKEVAEAIKPCRFYFPILNLEIEEPFKLGNVEFMYYTRKQMDELYEDYKLRREAKGKAMTGEEFKNVFRLKYQGRVLVKVEVMAEPNKAEELAKYKAAMAVDILKLFWATVLVPEQRTMFDLDYRLNYQVQTNYLSERSDKKDDFYVCVKWNNPYSNLMPEHLAFVLSNGLNEFSNFITLNRNDELYLLIIQGINFVANTLSTWDLNFRCISLITALESLLLKDEEKAISATVKDRLARLVSNSNEEDKRTREAFFHIYNVRNDMAHKAIRAEVDIQQLSIAQFMMVHLLRRLIDININRGCLTKTDFINGIGI